MTRATASSVPLTAPIAEDGLPERDGAMSRVATTYLVARCVVGVALLAAMVALKSSGLTATPWPIGLTGAYAAAAALLLAREWLAPRGPSAPVAGTTRHTISVGIDVLAFSALQLAEPGPNLNFAALLALPVLMAGILLPRRLAIGTAAGVSIVLLLLAARASLEASSGWAPLAPTGVAGIGLFLVAWLSGEIASRLAREQQRAQGSLQLARQQARLNRLMIDGMGEGVLVIDRSLDVQAANPAARRLLGLDAGVTTVPFALRRQPAWAALADAVEHAFAGGAWPDAGRDIVLAGQVPVALRVRLRFTQPAATGLEEAATPTDPRASDLCLVLAEEARAVQARVQQEKLAAMGRVSAGIAHEIRNPLAAIAQANALWSEDALSPSQRRLATIVSDNVLRLQRVVDDVLEVIPAQGGDPIAMDAADAVRRGVLGWSAAANVAPERVQVEAPDAPLRVLFDPEHLRRVLVNLLDNAHRHARPGPAAVHCELSEASPGWARLVVSNEGPAVPLPVQPHLFEPFFSTASRGSGLGLYICRELCERYGARIEYRPLLDVRAQRAGWPAFEVSLRRAA